MDSRADDFHENARAKEATCFAQCVKRICNVKLTGVTACTCICLVERCRPNRDQMLIQYVDPQEKRSAHAFANATRFGSMADDSLMDILQQTLSKLHLLLINARKNDRRRE